MKLFNFKLRYLVLAALSLHLFYGYVIKYIIDEGAAKSPVIQSFELAGNKVKPDQCGKDLRFIRIYIEMMNMDSLQFRARKNMTVPYPINAKRRDELAEYLLDIYGDRIDNLWEYGLPLLAGGNGFCNVESDITLKKSRHSYGYGELQVPMAQWIENLAYRAGDIKKRKLRGKTHDEVGALLISDWHYNIWLQKYYIEFLRKRYNGNARLIFSAYTAGMSVADNPESKFRNKRIEHLRKLIPELRQFYEANFVL